MSRRGNRGSVHRRGQTWVWYLDGEPDPLTGKRRQHTKGGYPTEAAAWEGLDEARELRRKGLLNKPSRLTVEAFLVDEWLPTIKTKVRPSTFAQYSRYIHAYVIPVIGTTKLRALKPTQLNKFYQHLLEQGRRNPNAKRAEAARARREAEQKAREARDAARRAAGRKTPGPKPKPRPAALPEPEIKRGLAPKTVRNIHNMLHLALGSAVKWEYVIRNVAEAADPPQGGSTEQHVWTPEQLRTYIRHVHGDRLYGLWVLVITTGMRRGEIAGLRRWDVDFDDSRVIPRRPRVVVDHDVVVSEPKTQRGKRGLAVDAVTLQALREHIQRQDAERARLELPPAGPETLLFTWPDGREVHPDLITDWFQQHARRAGLPVIRLHDARHSYATAAGKAGVHAKVLSERLGHASVAFTLQVYGHVLPGMDQDAADAVAALILGDDSDNEKAPPASAESAPVNNSVSNRPAGASPGGEVMGSGPGTD